MSEKEREREIILYYLGRRNGKNMAHWETYHQGYQQILRVVLDGLLRKIWTFRGGKISEETNKKAHLMHTHIDMHRNTVVEDTSEAYERLVDHLLANKYLIEFLERYFFQDHELPGRFSQLRFLKKRTRPKKTFLGRGTRIMVYDKESDIWWPYVILQTNLKKGRFVKCTIMCVYPRFLGCERWQGTIEERNLESIPHCEGKRKTSASWKRDGGMVLSQDDITFVQSRIRVNSSKPPETMDDILECRG